MKIKETLRKFIEQTSVISVLVFCSFLNYCIVQIIDPYFLPITIIPIFLAILFGYNIPIVTVILVGILDDIFTNSHLGLFAALYLFITYLLVTNKRFFTNKKISLSVFFIIFILTNIITHK